MNWERKTKVKRREIAQAVRRRMVVRRVRFSIRRYFGVEIDVLVLWPSHTEMLRERMVVELGGMMERQR